MVGGVALLRFFWLYRGRWEERWFSEACEGETAKWLAALACSVRPYFAPIEDETG